LVRGPYCNVGMLPLTSKDSFKSDDFKPGVKLKSRFFEWIKYGEDRNLFFGISLRQIHDHVFIHVESLTCFYVGQSSPTRAQGICSSFFCLICRLLLWSWLMEYGQTGD